MLALDCSTVCSRDVDVYADRQTKHFECGYEEYKRWTGLIKLLMRKFSEEQMKIGKYWALFGIGHVLRHDRFLHVIIEGRMRGKPTRGRRRIQVLHHFASDDGCVALKWAAEDREGWRHRERMSKTCCREEGYWRWWWWWWCMHSA